MDARKKELVGMIALFVPAVGVVASLIAYKISGYAWPAFASVGALGYSTMDGLVRLDTGRGLSERLFSPAVRLCGGVRDRCGWYKTWFECGRLGRGDEFV